MERKTRFELATLALARRCSTPEPLPHIPPKRISYLKWYARQESNLWPLESESNALSN